jgi:hypothetical protein
MVTCVGAVHHHSHVNVPTQHIGRYSGVRLDGYCIPVRNLPYMQGCASIVVHVGQLVPETRPNKDCGVSRISMLVSLPANASVCTGG